MADSSQTLPQTPIAPEKHKRVEWIDFAKAFALYLMVVGHHVANISAGAMIWIYSFHMPLFFFFSGVLYTPRSPKDTVRKDFKALFIPFLILNAICLVFYLGFIYPYNHIPYPDAEHLIKIIIVSLIGMGRDLEPGVHPVCVPLWFFVALGVIHVIASIGWRKPTVWLTIVSILCVIYTSTLMRMHSYNAPFSALMAFPFFTIGYLAQGIKKIDIHWAWAVLAIVLTAAPHYFLSAANGRVDMNNLRYGNSVVLFYLTSLLGIVMTCGFAILICSISSKRITQAMTTLASGGVLIVGLQEIPMLFTNKALAILRPHITDTTPWAFILTIAIMVVFIFLIKLSRKYFPPILGSR